VRRLSASALAIALALVAARTAGAQGYFGMNQVQYDRFDWRVKETTHFLIHYYPEEEVAASDAARMAERAYERLSRIIGHQFREKKPLIFFSSRNDFGQNNVMGDLGEGTGGVTEGLRHRVLMPFTGDYQSFEQILTHELVHSFQYDIFARGKAGGGLQTLQQVNPPYWFMEGMAEYLSTGPYHPLTDAWIRDAALNGKLPTIEQMTQRPDLYFPYRYGEALWEYVGKRFGDQVIGQILLAAPNVGIERAVKRETGLSLAELSDEWREAMQEEHLPRIPEYQRPRKFAKPILDERRTGAEVFVAPTLSPDGKQIAFISTGSFARGEIFFDLWLGNAETGKRVERLVKTTTDPNFEELRLMYSQSAFSPDGRVLAFTAMRSGRDVLYLLDVRRRKTTFRFELPLEGVTGPSFSPDGRRLVFSGSKGGITDLYIVDVDGKNLKQLTNDRYGDLQPQWSPDGKTIAFASDRGEATNFDILRFNRWRVTLLDLESLRIQVPERQAGHNLNPMWAPDGKSIAYVSDRTGIANVFLYDLATNEHYRLTNVTGSVSAFTEYSPAITWARGADRLAFTYFEDGGHTIWGIDSPRSLKKEPFRDQPSGPVIIAGQTTTDSAGRAGSTASGPGASTTMALAPQPPDLTSVTPPRIRVDSNPRRQSLYRLGEEVRESDELPATAPTRNTTLTVAQLLDSAAYALPDTTRFKDSEYKVSFLPEYIGRPTIGYAQDNWGRGVYGGTTLILSDMLGNHRLALAGGLNGRLADAQAFVAYTSLERRFQCMAGAFQEPYYFYSGDSVYSVGGNPDLVEQQQRITRNSLRQAFGVAQYPFNRFSRVELGLAYNHLDRSTLFIVRQVDVANQLSSDFFLAGERHEPGMHFIQPMAAYVSDNTLFSYNGGVMGRRFRFQVQPTLGSFRWIEYLADYRRYDPVIFNFITVATRVTSRMAVGPDEDEVPMYIGRPELLRGYNRELYSDECLLDLNAAACGAARLIGSRFAVATAELRIPLLRQFAIALLPIPMPPVDGALFYDMGMAWSGRNELESKRPTSGDLANIRYPLRSYGFGIRANLFGYALAKWDYAIPLDVDRKGFWTFSLGPTF
jgi:dipeptidyl aminopeptidase/acylaminoacyl peptidase